MQLHVKVPTAHIVFHQKDLSFPTGSVLQAADGTPIRVVKEYNYDRYELRVVEAAVVLAPGLYNLTMAYSAKFVDTLAGFYLSTYRLPDGTTQCVL